MYISEANKAKIMGAIAMRERNKAAALTVILSKQAGTHKARILSRKDAIKAAAHKRVDRKGLHHLVTRVRNQCIRMGVFPNS